MKDPKQELRKLRILVRTQCKIIHEAERSIDRLMQDMTCPLHERGRILSGLVNVITLSRQTLQRYGLGMSMRKIV
jgi:hypothetical protein